MHLSGHLVENGVDLGPDDHLKLSAFYLRGQNSFQSLQRIDVGLAVVLQIEPKPGRAVRQDGDVFLAADVGDDFRRQFFVRHVSLTNPFFIASRVDGCCRFQMKKG